MTAVVPEPKDSVTHLPPITRQCAAKSTTSGQRCRKPAMHGSTVCLAHGGGAPQVRRKAKLRLLELVEPAIATLAREMATAEKSHDRLRAAENILDRSGYPRRLETDPDTARALLVERLLALRAEAQLVVQDTPRVIENERTGPDDDEPSDRTAD